MDVDAPVDEKIPLTSLEEGNEEEGQPDPDEILQLDSGGGKIWLVKIPKFLMERWSTIDADNIHLATLRIWNERDPKTNKQHMSIYVPSDQPGAPPEEYKLDMVQESVENQIVIAEMDKEPDNASNRAKTTIISGRVKHEVNVRPKYNEKYSNRMRARHEAASEPVRTIKMMDDSPGGRGNINMLSSGANQRTASFDSFVRPSKGRGSQQNERFARMPKNQLYDALFGLFRERDYWSAKELRLRTEQPEQYLKEVLSGVATQHKSGPHNGLWELMPSYKNGGSGAGNGKVPYSSDMEVPTDVKMEGAEDDEDDEDDDMEEVD